IIRLASGKNWRCERPSVRLTSGSRRGATSSCATTSTPSARSAPRSPCSMPWSSRRRRIVASGAPTRRMISISCPRAWRISGLALQVDDDADALAPVRDGPGEVGGEQPEASEGGQRERDQHDRAHRNAAGASQVTEGLADQEAEHVLALVLQEVPSLERDGPP